MAHSSMTNGSIIYTQVLLLVLDVVLTIRSRRRDRTETEEPSQPAGSRWRRALPWLVIFAVTFALARYTSRVEEAKADTFRMLDEIHVRNFLASQPGEAIVHQAMRANFPNEYRAIMARFAEGRGSVTGLSAASGEQRYQWLRRMRRDIASFIRSQSTHVLRASDRHLAEIARKRRLVMVAFQDEPHFCAQLVTGQIDYGDPRRDLEAPPAQNVAIGTLQVALIEAARAGIDHPARRDRSSIQQQAIAALESSRLDDRTFNLLSDPSALSRASETDQCEAGVAYAQAVARLPDAQIAPIMIMDLETGTRRLN